MNYWITTHYPPHENDFSGSFYTGVWLQDGKQHVAAGMKPGDLVFKYESLTGPSRQVTLPSGKRTTQACPRGHMGVVAVMELTSGLYTLGDSAPTDYSDGSKKWWRYHAGAVCKDAEGFVPLAKLNTLLGFAENNRLRGFGDAHSGLKRIDKVTYDLIYAAFKQGK